jgi:II/X family phage/plasmid replication protein
MALDQSILETLPKSLTPVYALWEQGQDLRRFYSNTAFYRWRTKLLEHGIDISIVKDLDAYPSNIVPIIRYLEAVPMGITDWAYQIGLVA